MRIAIVCPNKEDRHALCQNFTQDGVDGEIGLPEGDWVVGMETVSCGSISVIEQADAIFCRGLSIRQKKWVWGCVGWEDWISYWTPDRSWVVIERIGNHDNSDELVNGSLTETASYPETDLDWLD